jgi:NAD-dependent DNA ligase
MEYFAEKLAMKGIGEGIVKRLYTGGVDSIPKMLKVTAADLLKLDGFQDTSAAKVVKEIHDAVRRADCVTFMHASNLFGRAIGSTKLKAIVHVYPNILTGAIPSETQVAGIAGIGPVTARQFLDSLPVFFAFMEEIGVPCVGKKGSQPQPLSQPLVGKTLSLSLPQTLVGKTFVFTGIRDKVLEATIEAHGGKLSSAVSGKTTAVIAKDPTEHTGKVKDALERGIPVVDIETFRSTFFDAV